MSQGGATEHAGAPSCGPCSRSGWAVAIRQLARIARALAVLQWDDRRRAENAAPGGFRPTVSVAMDVAALGVTVCVGYALEGR